MKPSFILAFAGQLLLTSAVHAHSVWVERDNTTGTFRVWFGGHADKVEPYLPAKLKTARAWDAEGKAVHLERIDAGDGVRLRPAGEPALIALYYDNGIHARTPEGRSVNLPMDQVPGATRATNAQKHHKTILAWTAFVTQPIGQPFEVTPLDAASPVAGKPMRLRVTADGKPAAGVKLGRGEDRIETQTGADGIASIVPVKGFNRIWAGQRIPVAGNAAYTELSYEYAFTFDVR